MIWINQIIQGVLLGGYYALIACGLSFMFSVMRIINLAHGSLAVLVGLRALRARRPLRRLAVPRPLSSSSGDGADRLGVAAPVLERSARGGLLVPVLSTFGLSIVHRQPPVPGFGADTRSLAPYIGDLSYDSWAINDDIAIGKLAALTLATAVALLGGIQVFLKRTQLGRAIRATAEDPDTVGLVGVNARRVNAIATAIAMVTVAVAGAFLAMRATFDPYAGASQLIFAFEAAVIGGAGSLWGTLIGGIVLGVAQSLGAHVSPQGFLIAGHVAFLVVAVRAPVLRRSRPARPAPRSPAEADMSAPTPPSSNAGRAESRVAIAVAAVIVAVARGRAGVFRRQRDRQADDAVHLRHPRGDVERAGRLSAAWCRSASRRSSALAPMSRSGSPTSASASIRRCSSPPLIVGALSWPLSRLMLRLKGGEFAIGMWVVAELAHLLVNLDTLIQGETGTSLIALNAYASRRAPRAHLLVRASPRWPGLLAIVFFAAAQPARRGDPGDPRQRGGRRVDRRAGRARQADHLRRSPPSARRLPARFGWRPRSPSSRRPISARSGPPT